MPSSKNPSSLQVGPGRLPPSQQSSSSGGGGSASDPTYYLERPIFSSIYSTYPVRTGTGNASLVLNNGPVWLGDNASEDPFGLFKLVGDDGEPLIEPSNRISISIMSWTGAALGAGWVDTSVTPITLNFNTSIANGVSYRVLYGIPATLANTADLQASNLVKVAGGLRERSKEDIYFSLYGGLNERYSRSNASGGRANTRTAGSGAVITRTGQAVTVQTESGDWGTTTPPDPFLACFKSTPTTFGQTSFVAGNGGDIGLLHITSDKATASGSEYTSTGRTKAAVASYFLRDVRGATVDGTTLTNLPAGTSATLNFGGNNPSQVYFSGNPALWGATRGTAIHYGSDILEVTFAGGIVRSYIIYGPGNDTNRLELRTLTGEVPSFVSGTSVTVRWFSAYLTMGGSQGGPFTWFQPRPVGTNFTTSSYQSNGPMTLVGFRPSDTSAHNPLFRIQASNQHDARINTFELSATGDFGTPPTAAQSLGGGLTTASGSVYSTFVQRYMLDSITANTTYYIDPRNSSTSRKGAGFGILHIAMAQALGVSVTITLTTGFTPPIPGMTCEIVLENVNGGLATLTWGADFKFSNPNDALLGTATTAGSIVKFKLTQLQLSVGTRWLVERQDYLP